MKMLSNDVVVQGTYVSAKTICDPPTSSVLPPLVKPLEND